MCSMQPLIVSNWGMARSCGYRCSTVQGLAVAPGWQEISSSNSRIQPGVPLQRLQTAAAALKQGLQAWPRQSLMWQYQQALDALNSIPNMGGRESGTAISSGPLKWAGDVAWQAFNLGGR